MTTSPAINLDKLRNAVQKYGDMSFTTAQVAADYFQNEEGMAEALFEKILHQHCALLGIEPLTTTHGGLHTVWHARS